MKAIKTSYPHSLDQVADSVVRPVNQNAALFSEAAYNRLTTATVHTRRRQDRAIILWDPVLGSRGEEKQ